MNPKNRSTDRRACFFCSFFMKRLTHSLLCLLLLCTVACNHNQRPSGVLDDNTMVHFLTDLYLVEGYLFVETEFRYDAMPPEVLDACDDILKKNNITRENVEKSFDYYSQHPDEYEAIQKKVLARIDEMSGTPSSSQNYISL